MVDGVSNSGGADRARNASTAGDDVSQTMRRRRNSNAVGERRATPPDNTEAEGRRRISAGSVFRAAAAMGAVYYASNMKHRAEQTAIAQVAKQNFAPKSDWKTTAGGETVRELYNAPIAGAKSEQNRIDREVALQQGKGEPFHTVTPLSRQSDKEGRVRVLSDEAQEKAKIKADNGRVVDGQGRQFAPGRYMMAMDMKKNVVITNVRVGGVIQHSSLIGSKPAIVAGEIEIGQDGKIKELNNYSGHYHPSKPALQRGKEAFEQMGFDMSKAKLVSHPEAHQTHPSENY